MPKIVVTLEYESEEALKKIAKKEGDEFISVENYLSRELGWIMESGFFEARITEYVNVHGILSLKTKIKTLMSKSETEEYIDTGECLDIFNEFLGCFEEEGFDEKSR